MEQKRQRRRSRRSRKARASWQRHLSVQRSSGQSQAAYCRKHRLDPRYFSVWKGKLAREARGVSRHAGATPALVSVRIKRGAAAGPVEARANDLSSGLIVRLPNGVVLGARVDSGRACAVLLGELARLPC